MGEMERPEPHDPSQLRISDDDRHQVAELLREAAAQGRLDLEELDERLEATYGARTYADLVPVTVDLPGKQVQPPGGARERTPEQRRSTAPATDGWDSTWVVLGDSKRTGPWRVPETHTAFVLMGDITLDLREATFPDGEVRITANAIMGDVKVIVDEHTEVHVEGIGIMGDFGMGKERARAALSDDSPSVRVTGMSLLGSVKVHRLPPRGTPKKYLGTY